MGKEGVSFHFTEADTSGPPPSLDGLMGNSINGSRGTYLTNEEQWKTQ